MNLLKEIENEQMAKLSAGKEIPNFQPGDTLVVNVKIVEGERARVQAYEGVCIGRAGNKAWHGGPCRGVPPRSSRSSANRAGTPARRLRRRKSCAR